MTNGHLAVTTLCEAGTLVDLDSRALDHMPVLLVIVGDLAEGCPQLRISWLLAVSRAPATSVRSVWHGDAGTVTALTRTRHGSNGDEPPGSSRSKV